MCVSALSLKCQLVCECVCDKEKEVCVCACGDGARGVRAGEEDEGGLRDGCQAER